MKHTTLLAIISLLWAPLAEAAQIVLGANFNEHLHVARTVALEATSVHWIRGFLPVGEFIDVTRDSARPGDKATHATLRSLQDDPGIATFRTAAVAGHKLAITLKWDFRRTHWHVPAPDSRDENAAFNFAVETVRTLRPDMLLLVNELYIDTWEEDLEPRDGGEIPMVRFLQRLAAHVAAAHLTAPDGSPLAVSCGGFTRLDLPGMRDHPATRALLPWLATSPHLTHVNLHLHQHSMEQFESAVKFIHEKIPARPLVVTEFSLVWAFQKGMSETLGSSPAGKAFAGKYHRPVDETCGTYLSAAAKKPVTEAELQDFLASRTWFDPQALQKMCDVMEENGVALATYAYLQASSGLERAGAPIGRQQPPWRLNPIFQELHAFVPGETRLARNLGFHETFIRCQKQRAKTKP